jgi:hypothetical protein
MAETARPTPWRRCWNIGFRTAHIGVTSVLFGGHVFGITAQRLLPWLYMTIATGAVLVVIEAYPNWRWCLEGRGAMPIAKVLLMCLVPWFWDYRVPILIAVVVIGSVGSHMPRRLRYRSLF